MAFICNVQIPLTALLNWGPAMGFAPSQDSYVFVDVRSTYTWELDDVKLLNYKKPAKYLMANAFMLSHSFGHVRQIMSTYDYKIGNDDHGPPIKYESDTDIAENENKAEENNEMVANEEEGDEIIEILEEVSSPQFDENDQCLPESGWICEHRWPAIVELVQLANSLCNVEDGVTNFQTGQQNQIAFCRGEKSFIAINNHEEFPFDAELHTCLPAGTYCDIISGGLSENGDSCLGKNVTVNENGNAQIQLAASSAEEGINVDADMEYGVIVIYVGAKLC